MDSLHYRFIFFYFFPCFPRACPLGRLIFAFLFSQMDFMPVSATKQIDGVTAAENKNKKKEG